MRPSWVQYQPEHFTSSTHQVGQPPEPDPEFWVDTNVSLSWCSCRSRLAANWWITFRLVKIYVYHLHLCAIYEIEWRRWKSNSSWKCSQERLSRGIVTSTMRRAARPSGCARCGAGACWSAITYKYLCRYRPSPAMGSWNLSTVSAPYPPPHSSR